MTTDDMRLVREYAARQSESAFATLVSRHTNLVYSAALRTGSFSNWASALDSAPQCFYLVKPRKPFYTPPARCIASRREFAKTPARRLHFEK
jgi:hypothetical protein